MLSSLASLVARSGYRSFVPSLLVIVAVAFAGPVASAQESRSVGQPRALLPEHATVHASVGYSGNHVSAGSVGVGGRLRLVDGLTASADWGVVTMADDWDGFGATTPQNPTLALHYGSTYKQAFGEIGLGASLPVATMDDSIDPKHYALLRGLSMHGYWDAWRWIPGQVSVFVPMRSSIDLGPVHLGLGGALALVVPTNERIAVIEQELDAVGIQTVLQLGVEALYRIGPVALGARGHLVMPFRKDSNETDLFGADWNASTTRASLSALARLDFGAGFAGVELAANLADPAFVLSSGDQPATVSVFASGGASF